MKIPMKPFMVQPDRHPGLPQQVYYLESRNSNTTLTIASGSNIQP
jgi:hypothetical protein